MTRMLCRFILIIFALTAFMGCTLFSSSEEDSSVAELSESADLLDEDIDELSSEIEDMGDEGGGEPFAEVDDYITEDDAFGDSYEDEFRAAEIDSDQQSFDEGELFYSETSEDGLDPLLATDELDDTAAFEEVGSDDQDLADFSEEDPLGDFDIEQDVSTEVETPSNRVTNLGYKAFRGGGTVVIETESPIAYDIESDANLNQLVVVLENVHLPERFKRPYITKDFKQDIATINAYQDEGSTSARVVVQLKRPTDPIVEQQGNSLLVMTSPEESINSEGQPEGSLMDLARQEEKSERPGGSAASAYIAGVPQGQSQVAESGAGAGMPSSLQKETVSDSLSLESREFTGERISLEFTDTDVRTIIEIIADKSGVNLIMDKDVEGSTSLRLRNVPWDQALVVVLRSQSLGYIKQGNVLRIAKQATLSAEAKAVSEQIKSEKEAKLYSSGLKVKYIPVSYAKVEDLAKKLKDFKSKEGKIAFDERTSSLVITDYPEYIDRVRELVKALDTPPMQVEIAAKLVEAREEFLREAGINWDISGSPFNIGGGRTGTVNSNFGGGSSDGMSLDLNVGTFDIFGDLTASLNLFEEQNKVKVLSQPRIVTMNKTKASINQTTQIPIETILPMMGAMAFPNITFEDLTLSLDVTPQITFKGDVILEVELKREFPGNVAANGQIEINRRNAKTTIMVKNGKTAVIGGIYQLDDTDRDTGVPWLKDIPLLGYLFKQIELRKSKNELLLFLKPKILKEEELGGSVVGKLGIGSSQDEDEFDELIMDAGDPFEESLEAAGDDSIEVF